MSIHIREADSSEAEALSRIIRESFRDVAKKFDLTPQNCPTHPSNCTVDWISNDMERGITYYLLEYSGRLTGCVALETSAPDEFYLERLSVLPEYRRHGLGRALVDHVFNRAEGMGAKQISIGIISEQADLKSWYRKIGFVEKETKEFSHLPFVVSFMEYQL